MKKIVAILMVITLALSLCACPALEQGATSGKPQVHITVGKVEPGMTVKDILVEVTIDHQPVPCRIKLTGFVWDGYWDMAEDEPVQDSFAVRVDIFYSLPKGCDVEDVDITMECDGGNYDGTGSISNDAEGNIEAWSRAFYGKEPLPPETEATEQTQPPETQPHTHNWVEVPGSGIVSCTADGIKMFTCSCGETKSEKVRALGHDWNPWNTTPGSCLRPGSRTTTCKRCGETLTEEIPAPGHTWSNWIKETGLIHIRTCSVCNAREEEQHTIPAGSVTCTGCGADIIN